MAVLTALLRARVFVVLMLAIVGLQAMAPIRAPLERLSGSAFNAATLDVSLASSARIENRGQLTALLPAVTVDAPRTVAIPPPARIGAAGPTRRPNARGPPPRMASARPPDSTAPPRS